MFFVGDCHENGRDRCALRTARVLDWRRVEDSRVSQLQRGGIDAGVLQLAMQVSHL